MEYTVFISRTLKDDSPFFSSLNGLASIKAYSLLEFSPVSFVQPLEVDMIFFYSSNAVRFFFSQLNAIPTDSKFCCIGEGTAATLRTLGHEPYFIGKGNPEDVAYEFLKVCKNKKVLFPRAQNSKLSIQKIIENDADVLDIVVYENRKKKVFLDPKADLLVFTSPMNVAAYFDRFPYRNEKLLAIGNTTLSYLKGFGFENVVVSNAATEVALADAARKILFDKI